MKYLCLWLAVLMTSLAATPGAADERGTSKFDRIWSHATLYDNETNPTVQRFALSGRLQPESAWFDSEQGDFADEFLWRRFRFGFKSDVFNDWVLHLEGDFDLNGSLGNFYGRLTDAYIGWSPTKDLHLKFIKQSVGFTLDGATSSKNLLTMQRNNLTNNLWFTREYFTGVGAKGEFDRRWDYQVGAFSNEDDNEISSFDAALFSLVSLGRNIGPGSEVESGLVRVDYVYNQEDENAGTRPFSHVLSLVTEWEGADWGLMTDLSAGRGYGEQSDVWGWVVMPYYNFNPRYQLLFRFTYVTSKGDNGVRLPRYEGLIVDGEGNEYSEAYIGLNVFFYGHKLKWQTGVELGNMVDDANDGGEYQGIGLNTGIRIYW
jgi:phosphate-selective porin OprO/OprP